MKKYLKELFRLRPFLFSTFYQRAKLVQMRPLPVGAFLNLEVTKACCLKCDFCLAAGKNNGPENLSLDMARKTLDLFEGVQRVVLLGGEPLMHPEIIKLLGMVADIGAKVEIYTNGMLLGDKAEMVKNRCEQLGALNPSGTIITLAMDSNHASQLGTERLNSIVEGALDAHRNNKILLRFNVTDERINTSDYLSANLVLEILGEINPLLADELRRCCADGSVAERFFFNPVVRMGRAQSEGFISSCQKSPEFIRAQDLTKRVELTAVLEHDESIGIYSWLNAMWIDPVPDSVLISKIEKDMDKLSARIKLKNDILNWSARVFELDEKTFSLEQRRTIAAWLLGENKSIEGILDTINSLSVHDPSLDPVLDLLQKNIDGEPDRLRFLLAGALASRHRWQLLAGWYTGRTYREITKPILDYLIQDKGPALDLSSFFRFCPFALDVLKEFIRIYYLNFPGRESYLTDSLLSLLAPNSAKAPFVIDPEMADAWNYPFEASQALVDTGVSAIDKTRVIKLLTARLVAWPGSGLEVHVPGLSFKTASSSCAAKSWYRLLELLAAVLPLEQRRHFAFAFSEEPGFVELPELVQERLKSWTKGLEEKQQATDPIRIFESLTYEPNEDYLPWDDRTLASMIERLGLPGWTDKQVRELLQHFIKTQDPEKTCEN